jgi:catechol 2,3-dioxygenase-like lactoylglutathione lyase family enzyme
VTPRLNLIGIVVSDMNASLEFYRRLGLDVPEGAEQEGHVELTLPGGLRLAWDTVEVIESFDPRWTAPTGGARFGLAFLVDSPAEVDALYAELVGLGYGGHLEPFDAFWGQRYAVIRDPDGNDVALFAPVES